MGEVVCVLGTSVSVVVAMLAARPLRWQHEPFNAQLNPIGGMVGSLPRPPPHGLTCASMGPGVHLPGLGHHLSGQRAGHRARVRRMRSQKHKRDTRLTGLPTLPMPPQIRRRRNPEGSPLVACGRRAVGAEKSRYQQHVESYNTRSALLRPGLVDLGLSAVLPATEKHRQRRGQSRVLHANLDHGRAHRLVGATAGNDTAGQRSGPTATRDKPRTPNGLPEHATT